MTNKKHDYNWDAMEFDPDEGNIEFAFSWYKTPQGRKWWSDNRCTYAGESEFDRMKRLYAEDMAAKEGAQVGTLFDLGVRKGDVVRSEKTGMEATISSVMDNKIYIESDVQSGCQDFFACFHKDEEIMFRIVSRAGDSDKKEGPVRTVTKKEIVPGFYGCVSVSHAWPKLAVALIDPNVKADHIGHANLTKADLTDAIETLTQIRDALDG